MGRVVFMSMRGPVVAVAFALACSVALPATSAPKATKKARKAVVDTRPTVAVLYFDYTGKDAEMAMLRKGLAQMMISDLSTIERVRIVERERLQAIIGEMKLQRGHNFDKKTAARIGKLLGARYMVLGGYFAMMGSLRIDARVVAVETGVVVRSIGANGKVGDFMALEQKVSAGLADVLRTKLPKLKLRTAKARSKAHAKTPRKRRKRAKPPKVMHAKDVIQYAKALDAKDRGDMKLASAEMKKVVAAHPDFELAAMDLAAMVQ
jgi:TolB-like protein